MAGLDYTHPKENPNELYVLTHVDSGYSISDILMAARSKWPDVNLEDLDIAPDFRQVKCFGYDLFDWEDYSTFLLITNRAYKDENPF